MNLNKFEGAKVLIVDDEPANLSVLYNLLTDLTQNSEKS